MGITESALPTMKEILGKHLIAKVKLEGIETKLNLLRDERRRKALE
jgi:hypothetical protein